MNTQDTATNPEPSRTGINYRKWQLIGGFCRDMIMIVLALVAIITMCQLVNVGNRAIEKYEKIEQKLEVFNKGWQMLSDPNARKEGVKAISEKAIDLFM